MTLIRDSDVLPLSPVLSGLACLTKLTMHYTVLMDIDVAFQQMPAVSCLKELVLDTCTIKNPGVLERAVARLSSLSHLHLVCVNAYDWRFDSPVTMNNPWFSLLRSFFSKYQNRLGGGMLHWFSIPITTSSLHVCEAFSCSEWIGTREGFELSTMQMRLIILIQDAQQKTTDDLVQMWLYGRLIVDDFDPMGTSVAQKLKDTDVQMVLTELDERMKMTRPSFAEPKFASHAALHAFALLWNERTATVYACNNVEKMHLFGPHDDE
ncbi:hypothetical protein BC940DRAFT_308612 [Gongronella butleri]|nr:hypothetical protein BC940DRAFT_308612 [Gongronella butleri]